LIQTCQDKELVLLPPQQLLQAARWFNTTLQPTSTKTLKQQDTAWVTKQQAPAPHDT
jgi:hypothetical protein